MCQEIIAKSQSLTFDQISTSWISTVLYKKQTLLWYIYNAPKWYDFYSETIPESLTLHTVFFWNSLTFLILNSLTLRELSITFDCINI